MMQNSFFKVLFVNSEIPHICSHGCSVNLVIAADKVLFTIFLISPWEGFLTGYPQDMLSWRNKKNIMCILLLIWSYAY